jgi:hypothetical protein
MLQGSKLKKISFLGKGRPRYVPRVFDTEPIHSYQNVVHQALMYCPLFYNWTLSHDNSNHAAQRCIMCIYQDFVQEYWLNPDNADQPMPFQMRIANAAAMAEPVAFGNSGNMEAGKFYEWLTDQMKFQVPAGGFQDNDTDKWHWNQEHAALFQLDYSFTQTCKMCHESQREPVGSTTMIECDFYPGQQNLMQILDESFFNQDRTTHCANCGDRAAHSTSKKIVAAPQVLRIRVNIVGLGDDNQVKKFLDAWDVPMELILGQRQENTSLPLDYRLQSSIAHGEPDKRFTSVGKISVHDIPGYESPDLDAQPNLDFAQLGNLDFLDLSAFGNNAVVIDSTSSGSGSPEPIFSSDDSVESVSSGSTNPLEDDDYIINLNDFDGDAWLAGLNDVGAPQRESDMPTLYSREHIGAGIARRSLTPIREDPRRRGNMGDFTGLIPMTEAEYNEELNLGDEEMSDDSQLTEKEDESEEPDALERGNSSVNSPLISEESEMPDENVVNRGPGGGHHVLHVRTEKIYLKPQHISEGHFNDILWARLNDNPQRPGHSCSSADGYQVVVLTYTRMELTGKWAKMERDFTPLWRSEMIG